LTKAAAMSAKAVKLEPENSSFLDTYAWILYQKEEYKEAKKWMLKALENGGDKSSTILDHYGDVLFRLGNVDEALRYWNKAKEKGMHTGILEQKILKKGLDK